MSLFSKPDIVLNFYCPHCSELLPYGTKQCKYCLEKIEEERAEFNTTIYFVLTQANSMANTVGTGDPAVIIFVVVSLILRWLKVELYEVIPGVWIAIEVLFGLVWLLPLAAVVIWLYSHGRWRIIDEEYESKKKSMWLSLRMWLAAYAFHVILILLF